MAHLIDKDASLAEIERLENKLYYEPENFKDVGAKMALDSLKSFLNTLEVKEVDLEKEINDYHITKKPTVWFNTLEDIAKHFFELGLKAKQV